MHKAEEQVFPQVPDPRLENLSARLASRAEADFPTLPPRAQTPTPHLGNPSVSNVRSLCSLTAFRRGGLCLCTRPFS